MSMNKISAGDCVRHGLTGQEAKALQVFKGKLYLGFWFGDIYVRDWFSSRDWTRLASAQTSQ